jgi:hypothetical protein
MIDVKLASLRKWVFEMSYRTYVYSVGYPTSEAHNSQNSKSKTRSRTIRRIPVNYNDPNDYDQLVTSLPRTLVPEV